MKNEIIKDILQLGVSIKNKIKKPKEKEDILIIFTKYRDIIYMIEMFTEDYLNKEFINDLINIKENLQKVKETI